MEYYRESLKPRSVAVSNPVANFSFTATLLAHKRVSSPLALRSPILTQSLTVQVLRDCKLVLSVQIFNLAANCAPCKRTTFELEKPNGERGVSFHFFRILQNSINQAFCDFVYIYFFLEYREKIDLMTRSFILKWCSLYFKNIHFLFYLHLYLFFLPSM